MKKLFAMLLALCLVLSLAACGDPESTKNNQNSPTDGGASTTQLTPTTVPDTKQEVALVTSYTDSIGILATLMGGEYTLHFSYNDIYSGGTVQMKVASESVEGSFTCDSNYNINYIELNREDAKATMTMTFDNQHRLLSADIREISGSESRQTYYISRTYDDQGRTTRDHQKYSNFGGYESVVETQYNDQGQILRQKATITTGAGTGQTTTSDISYSYDENGCISFMESLDEKGNVLIRLSSTYEIKENVICYTFTDGESKIYMEVDPNTQSTMQENYAGDQLINRNTTVLDAQGRLIRQVVESIPINQTIRSEYSYTSDGRLLQQSQYVNDEYGGGIATTFETVEIPT